MLTRALPLLALALFALTACSSPEPGPPPRSAEQVVTDLIGRVQAAQPGTVFTEATDPNHLLGRPGQYTSAATFTDSRVPDELAATDGVEAGGKVEVFASEDEATSRSEYIAQIGAASPLGVEWRYQSGPVLVRVSRGLTEAQAQEYRTALG